MASVLRPKLLGKGRHSRSGSTTSLSSFTIDGNKEESTSSPSLDLKLADGKVVTPKEFKKLEAKEEEWRRKLQKKEEEFTVKLKKTEELWKKQLEDRERELKKVIDRKESEKRAIEEERNDLRVKNEKLEESAKKAADYQKKVCQYQEDIDQLEGFQTQEMAKIKHLLLVMEQEVAEKDKLLKDNNSQMEALKVELVKLRKFEQEYESIQDELESMRHAFNLEKNQLSSDLSQREEDVRHLKDRVAILEQRLLSGNSAELTVNEQVQALLAERSLMERRLEEAHLYLSEIKSNWSNTIASLETQVGRLCRQASEESAERRQAELDRDTANAKITELSEEIEKLQAKIDIRDAKLERMAKEKENLEEDLKQLKSKTEEKVGRLQEEIVS
ncbi:UNVERIFIED_CONTAM: hypothetical protein PYX00_006375 [Menopon gallinae]|uniref:Uncharacterized protein n=1 Tax=Menopon gallinae TaxID=328185 RepID=A0AAW2HV40_9NEOP